MIIVIDSLNAHRFKQVLDEVFRLRARVFKDRLGWDVNVVDDREIDHFDNLDPAHVVCFDDDGNVVGCMRLLQTTGPHMLADVFYDLLDGEPPLRSSQIWEATRFCVDTKRLNGTTGKNTISYVTSMVMLGAFEYAKAAGVLDAVAVIDPVMNRVLRRSGNGPYDYLGSPRQMGVVKAMAALMDCSEERINNIRTYAKIEGDVFLSEEEALEHFAKRSDNAGADKLSNGSLLEYCQEQMNSAQNLEEYRAAMRLYSILSGKFPLDVERENGIEQIFDDQEERAFLSTSSH